MSFLSTCSTMNSNSLQFVIDCLLHIMEGLLHVDASTKCPLIPALTPFSEFIRTFTDLPPTDDMTFPGITSRWHVEPWAGIRNLLSYANSITVIIGMST